MKEGQYYGTHWYWDEEDREYIICATWFYEKNYPEMPDYVTLEEIEVEDQEPGSPDLDLSVGGPVWKSVYNDGMPMADAVEVDYL
jgi:hypothetical protein